MHTVSTRLVGKKNVLEVKSQIPVKEGIDYTCTVGRLARKLSQRMAREKQNIPAVFLDKK